MIKSNLLIVLLFALIPAFAFSQTADQKTVAKTDSAAYSVKGMDCQGCVSKVEGTLKKVDGIASCKVSLKEGKAMVEFDPAKTSKDQIESALKTTGYDIALLKTEETAVGEEE